MSGPSSADAIATAAVSAPSSAAAITTAGDCAAPPATAPTSPAIDLSADPGAARAAEIELLWHHHKEDTEFNSLLQRAGLDDIPPEFIEGVTLEDSSFARLNLADVTPAHISALIGSLLVLDRQQEAAVLEGVLTLRK